MKKIMLLSGICLVVAAFSCNQSGTKNKTTSTAPTNKPGDSLLILAKKFFTPLPAVAENNANQLTAEKVQLGKVLYYDTRLSRNGTISCNSCHDLSNFGVV